MGFFESIVSFIQSAAFALVVAALVMTVALSIRDYFHLSVWWVIGATVAVVIALVLVPYGSVLFEIWFSDRPPIQLWMSKLSVSDYKTLTVSRFIGGVGGVVGGFAFWGYFRRPY